jgi:hypothetical protein
MKKKFAFTALAFTALIWGTTAVALRQSQEAQTAIEETGADPGWSVAPAHMRMW